MQTGTVKWFNDAKGFGFIAPDNGVLSWALRGQSIRSIRQMTNETLFRHPVSRTFHGRDIFAPTAAHLAAGKKFMQVGPETSDWVQLPWPTPKRSDKTIVGEVLHIDRFGNAITNLPHDSLSEVEWARAQVVINRRKLGAPRANYATAKPKHSLAILSSSGFLEIAVNGGSAEKQLKLKTGSKVTLKL